MLRLLFFSLLFSNTVFAQTTSHKRALTPDDYDRWQTVKAEKMADDGQWISWQVDPQEGDGTLYVAHVGQTSNRQFARGYAAQFTPDSKFLVMRLKAPLADTRKAKLKKLRTDQLPKDSLLVLNLTTGQTTKFPNLKSVAFGKEGGTWLAVLQDRKDDKEKPAARMATPKDTLAPTPPSSTTVARKVVTKKPKGDDLTLLNLNDGTRRLVRYVSSVVISDNGQTVFYNKEVPDSLKATSPIVSGVYLFDTQKKAEMLVDTNARLKIYKGLAVDKTGQHLAWMASADSAGADVRTFSLYYKNQIPIIPAKNSRRKKAAVAPVVMNSGTGGVTIIADTLSLPNRWAVNEYREPKFSDDGQRLYFAASAIPPKIKKDTLTPDDEKVRVDVWSWTDSRLQPMQQKRLKEEKERGFLSVYDMATHKATLLANRDVPTVDFDPKVHVRHLLGLSDLPYQVQASWDPGHTDLYLIDTQTGQKTKIANDVMATQPRLSPGGKWAYWFDERDSLWRAWSVADGKRIDLTRGLPHKFFDEEHDTPNLPGAYGSAGWTQNDRYLWLYDRYDIWQIDPTGAQKPLNLTNGWGRKHRVRLRRVDLDTDEKAINAAEALYLTGFWEETKQTGLLRSTSPTNGLVTISLLVSGNHRYAGLTKARKGNTLLYYRGNFREPNNLFQTQLGGPDSTFSTPIQLTHINPQQDSVRWGNVELVKWTGTNGVPLEGLLYKPDGFDERPVGQTYPMLVYFYERNAETLNDYRAPAPSRSTINIPYCVSNGYLVFVPDIVYTTGQPGPNAYDCIVPGVLSLLNRGIVDRDRIGIQGQSWGGYQTAFIITRTNLFRAAMAGAAVANMTSAYGGIRWETGISRQFQYEKTQSRIGGTLWDKPMNYIENSPLFYANRVQTPLLTMHNDADGAVPWQQGIEFFTALRRLNKPVWMLVYNGEGHNLTSRYNGKDLSIRMYQFFDHYLKDAPLPVWMKEGRSAVEKDRGELKY